MRLTLSDAMRGMAELDGLSADERNRLVARAKHWHKGSVGCGCVVTLLVLVWLIVLIVPMLLSAAFGRAAEGWLWLATPGLLALAVLLALHMRDVELRRMLRGQLQRVRCRACGVHMMGSARSADMVRCRGCAKVYLYSELCAEPEDFGPPLLVLDRYTKCPGCLYSWSGLTSDAGCVRCPECGREEGVVVPGEPA